MKKLLGLILALMLMLQGCAEKDVFKQRVLDWYDDEGSKLLLVLKNSKDDAGLATFKFVNSEGTKIIDGGDRLLQKSYCKVSESDIFNFYYMDEKNNLYVMDKDGKENLIVANVVLDSLRLSYDGTTAAFLVSDDPYASKGTLYRYTAGSDKEKIAQNIASYDMSLSTDGKSVVYIDENENLYRWSVGSELEKIAAEVYSFSMPSELREEDKLKQLIIKDTDKKLFIQWAGSDDKEKLSDKPVVWYESSENGSLVAFNVEEGEEDSISYGKLYVCQKGLEPVKLADEAIDFSVSYDGSGILYRNRENKLFMQSIKKVEPGVAQSSKEGVLIGDAVKLGEEVERYYFSPAGDLCIFNTEDGTLRISRKGSSESAKLADDVEGFMFSADRIAFYKDAEGSLHEFMFSNLPKEVSGSLLDSTKKITDSAQSISFSRNLSTIGFSDVKGNAYLRLAGGEPIKLTFDPSEYDSIYFDNAEIASMLLSLESLSGKWKVDDGMICSIEGDKFYLESRNTVYNGEIEFEGDDRYSGSARIIPDEGEDLFFTISLDSEGKVMTFKDSEKEFIFKKVDSTVFDEAKALIEKVDANLEVGNLHRSTDGYAAEDGIAIYMQPSEDLRTTHYVMKGQTLYISDYNIDANGNLWYKTWLTNYDDWPDVWVKAESVKFN